MKIDRLLFLVGLFLLAIAAINAPKATSISYLVGSCLPGLALIIIGLKLEKQRKAKAPPPSEDVGSDALPLDVVPADPSVQLDEKRADSFKSTANWGVLGGIILMFTGGAAIPKANEQPTTVGLLVPLFIWLVGWSWLIWGCVNYMRWKGRSGWFGLFGYLFLPGLIILACFPNRRKQLLQQHESDQTDQLKALSAEDQRSGYRFQLALAPQAIFFVGACVFFLFGRASNVDAAEWQEIAPEGLEFQALMPGTPEVTKKIQETPVGNVELFKFTVNPKGKKELFMIVVTQSPEVVFTSLGGREKVLELGKNDLLSASQGKLKSEKHIMVGESRGLEVEILPPQGAIIVARVFATNTRLFEISAHVPKIRSNSKDVGKFFNSFRILTPPRS